MDYERCHQKGHSCKKVAYDQMHYGDVESFLFNLVLLPRAHLIWIRWCFVYYLFRFCSVTIWDNENLCPYSLTSSFQHSRPISLLKKKRNENMSSWCLHFNSFHTYLVNSFFLFQLNIFKKEVTIRDLETKWNWGYE